MNIYLVRHLEYENPDKIYVFHLPVILSPKGRKDAEKVATWFANKQLQGLDIFTSPIVRCVQTAHILAAKINSSITVDERLIEIHCKNLQGKKILVPHWLEEDDETRETKKSTTQRIISIYEEKVQRNKDCILVSHGEPLTVLYYHLLNKSFPRYLWNPAIINQVVQRGDVVVIKIKNNKLNSIIKTLVIEESI